MKYVELENMAKNWNGKVCIFGAGWIGKTWGYDIITLAGFKVDWYYDNKLISDKEIRDGIRTINFEKLCEEKENTLIFVTVNEKLQEGIRSQLLKYDIHNYVMMGYWGLQELCISVIESNDGEVMQKYRTVVDDKEFLKSQFKFKIGDDLRLDNPKTFNEKLQWLKLYDRNPKYTKLVDKYEFKEYIANTVGEEYVIPTLGVWDRVEDIEWDKLPNQFVIKCTHDSGSVFVCRNKRTFDIKKVSEGLKKALARNFYWVLREWPYKDVQPRILAEQLIENSEGELTDYKFFSFDGKVRAMFIATERGNELEETKFDYFDREFRHLDLVNGHPNAYYMPKKPSTYDKMISLTERLTKGIPHVRVDFYEVNGKIYFGEFTFFHWSGVVPFEPKEWDLTFGNWIKLND